jgi:N-acetylneuraminic acid mutarotase
MSNQVGPQTGAAVKDTSGFSPWWFRLGAPIVVIDIAIQALIIWSIFRPDRRTVGEDAAWESMGIAYAVLGSLVITVPGNLIALVLAPMAIYNWRRTGKGLWQVFLYLAVWIGPLIAVVYDRFDTNRRSEISNRHSEISAGTNWAKGKLIRNPEKCSAGSYYFVVGCKEWALHGDITPEEIDAKLPLLTKYVLHDGEVLDTETKLTWSRCAVGQLWQSKGGCQGEIKTFTFEEAQKLGDDVWRVPAIVELRTLIDHNRQGDPTIDVKAFPNMIAGETKQFAYWSSTVGYSSDRKYGLAVYFKHGYGESPTGGTEISSRFRVRLVRASTAPHVRPTVEWTTAGRLSYRLYEHTATLLRTGKVLVAGGKNTIAMDTVELYDPVTGSWEAAASLGGRRSAHTSTLLKNGKVLIVGGNDGVDLRTGELYDPARNTWKATGLLAKPRSTHTATLLPNGKVLVAGGRDVNSKGNHSSVELYDPATNAWTAAASLKYGRAEHTATLLRNGEVLVSGGIGQIDSVNGFDSAELYDPAANTWRVTRSLASARYAHTATLLPNGQVLVVGGVGRYGEGRRDLFVAELYDPETSTWKAPESRTMSRAGHTATLLSNGQVLVAAGSFERITFNNVELFDPATNIWTAVNPNGPQGKSGATPRSGHTATMLSNGKVLLVGGTNLPEVLSSPELFDVGTVPGKGL